MRHRDYTPLWIRIFSIWLFIMGPYFFVQLMNAGYFPKVKEFFTGEYFWVALIPGLTILVRKSFKVLFS